MKKVFLYWFIVLLAACGAKSSKDITGTYSFIHQSEDKEEDTITFKDGKASWSVLAGTEEPYVIEGDKIMLLSPFGDKKVVSTWTILSDGSIVHEPDPEHKYPYHKK